MTDKKIKKRICKVIRDYDSKNWGLKGNKFIEKYCSFFPVIYECVCNKSLDLERLNTTLFKEIIEIIEA